MQGGAGQRLTAVVSALNSSRVMLSNTLAWLLRAAALLLCRLLGRTLGRHCEPLWSACIDPRPLFIAQHCVKVCKGAASADG